MVRFFLLSLSLMFLGAAAAGCSKSGDGGGALALHPVGGTVTRNGQPVGPFAQVTFSDENNQLTITGVTDAAGKFKVGTVINAKGDRKDGAPEGSYTVMIMPPLDDKQGGSEMPVTLAEKYQVKSGPNEFQFEIAPKKKK